MSLHIIISSDIFLYIYCLFTHNISTASTTVVAGRLAPLQQQLLRQRGAGPAEGLTALREGATLQVAATHLAWIDGARN